ncbi:MAG: hypothetical protein MK042_09610 [Cognatishimia sp.]|nr:hypothetical protein [Cognatishimia sp.]
MLDDNLYRVVAQRDHFNRYYFVAAIGAPIALYSVADDDSAFDAIRHAEQAFARLNEFDESLGICADRTSGTDTNCPFANTGSEKTELTNTSYGFEHNSLATQRAIARLGSDIRQNIGLNVDISDATDVASSLVKVLSDLSDLVGPMRNIAASYRDTMQIVALSASRKCTAANLAAEQKGEKKKPKCEALEKATKSYYDAGQKPPNSILSDSGEPERVIRTLRRLTYDVIESGELGKSGFLDNQGKRALAAVIREACAHSTKFITDTEDNTAAKTSCAAISTKILESATKTETTAPTTTDT